MKSRYTLFIIWLLAAGALVLAGCKGKPKSETLSLDGAWTLRHIVDPMGNEYEYPSGSETLLRIYANDSAMYECQFIDGANGQTVTPTNRVVATLINSIEGEYLYFENSDPHPLNVLNDSTITIQDRGCVYTWGRASSLSPVRIDEIQRLIASDDLNDDTPHSYVFSVAEDELKQKNNVQAFVIAGALVVLIAVGFFARDEIKRRKQEEQRRKQVKLQLRQLKLDREVRLQQVTDVLKRVEDDFFSSADYVDLRNRVKHGKIKHETWNEIDKRLNSIYAGFTGKLLGQYPMSDTELHVCLLLKLRMSPSEIAEALCKDASSISTVRSRLYKKVFNKAGSPKDWDEFILSL